MKNIVITLISALIVDAVDANNSATNRLPKDAAVDAATRGNIPVMKFVLTQDEIPRLTIRKYSLFNWGIGENQKRKKEENPDVYQEFLLGDIDGWIRYSMFLEANEAYQAIVFYLQNITSVFTKGIWKEADKEINKHQSWYYEGENSVGVIVLSGTSYFQISCHDGDAVTRKKVCEQIALKIIEKIKQGEHVIMPEEKPAPPAKGNGTTK